MEDKRLFLLDAYALIFRAYYALIKMPRITSSGFNTSAIFGFVNTLEELLRKENPSHIAVCFDPSGPTFRHEAFAGYKGERDATPEDIKQSVPVIKEIIRAYRIPILEVEGFEADDVIGTVATLAQNEGFDTFMMTPDKDFAQLVSPRIFQYKPAYRGQEVEIRGVDEVCSRYGIDSPCQVIDLLALMGDKVDNIPGCPGVGEKTASQLIREFGSIENLLANTHKLKGALAKKISDNSEQIEFSRFLATIRTDVPVEIVPAELKRQKEDIDNLLEIFRRLEFRTLAERIKKRLQNDMSVVQISKSLFDFVDDQQSMLPTNDSEESTATVLNVSIADTSEKQSMLYQTISREKECGIYIVTDGKSDMTAEWIGCAVVSSVGDAWWIPANVDGSVNIFLKILADNDITKVCDNVKQACVLALRFSDGNSAVCNFFDTQVSHYLIQPEMRHSLEIIVPEYLGFPLQSFENMANKEVSSRNRTMAVADIPLSDLAKWAASRAGAALKLRPKLISQIETAHLHRLLDEIEFPLIPVLAQMEYIGVSIDVTALDEASRSFSLRIENIERQIFSIAGEEFNVGSPAKVGEILFDRMKLDSKAKKTKTGQYSTAEETLLKIVHLNPIVQLILDWRKLKKLLSTYILALPASINSDTGKIHTTYNQTVTATGRISSSEPNLQNIPVRDDEGKEIRRAFIPSPGRIFLSADYSQIELRLVADLANDETMLDAFAHDKDIHTITASRIYKKDLEDVTQEQRRNAKTANFGILYGISAFGLASRLSIPRAEAKRLIDGYFATFPAVKNYMEKAIQSAKENGFVTTVHGRRRMLPDISSRNPVVRGYAERNAINAPIQGTAADIIKIAMVRIHNEILAKSLKSKMIMQVHDELNFDVVPDELPVLREIVTRCMQQAYSGKVILIASCGVGCNWLSAH